jgi:hypothetical protein
MEAYQPQWDSLEPVRVPSLMAEVPVILRTEYVVIDGLVVDGMAVWAPESLLPLQLLYQ